jgi:hypothetical protein
MKRKPIKNRREAREFAIAWQLWQSTRSLSCGGMVKWQEYFREAGRKFHLLREFRENGII